MSGNDSGISHGIPLLVLPPYLEFLIQGGAIVAREGFTVLRFVDDAGRRDEGFREECRGL